MTLEISKRAVATVATSVLLSLGASFAVATAFAPQGPVGKTGATGQTGEQGPQGERGPRGRHGKTGKRGANGANGANGVNGATVVHDRACSNDLDVPLPYCD